MDELLAPFASCFTTPAPLTLYVIFAHKSIQSTDKYYVATRLTPDQTSPWPGWLRDMECDGKIVNKLTSEETHAQNFKFELPG